MDKILIYRQGCDLTTNNPTLLNYSPTIVSRYDAGICNHRLERVGVLEIFKINKDQAQLWMKK